MEAILKIVFVSCCLVALFQLNAQPKIQNPVKFLALGDSYTIGQSVFQDESWPYQFADRLETRGYSVDSIKVIARTGWRTDDLLSAIDSENILNGSFNLVSLLIGVNNQFQGIEIEKYKVEFRQLLQIAISISGGDPDKVFVLSIPDYKYTPFGNSLTAPISSEIDEYNRINEQISNSFNVKYFNITEISRRGLDDPSLVASDNLHPSGEMYKLWVDLVARDITRYNMTTSNRSFSNNTAALIYPTVFTNEIQYNSVEAGSRFVIYNATGIKVLDERIENHSGSFNLSQFEQGVYLYSVLLNNQIIEKGRLVKAGD